MIKTTSCLYVKTAKRRTFTLNCVGSKVKVVCLRKIRNYRNIRVFDTSSRLIMLEAMTEAALTKDDPADLINVAIEKLVRQHYELPAFSDLAKAAEHVHVKSYRELYEKIYNLLDVNARSIIDDLFKKTPSQSPYTLGTKSNRIPAVRH